MGVNFYNFIVHFFGAGSMLIFRCSGVFLSFSLCLEIDSPVHCMAGVRVPVCLRVFLDKCLGARERRSR